MSTDEMPRWSVVPASDRVPCDSWQMFRKYDGIEEFFGGFWPNQEDAIAEARELDALEARARWAEEVAKPALERLLDGGPNAGALLIASTLAAYPQPVEEAGL